MIVNRHRKCERRQRRFIIAYFRPARSRLHDHGVGKVVWCCVSARVKVVMR